MLKSTMFLKSILLCLFFGNIYGAESSYESDVLKMLIDFIKYYQYSQKIFTYTCWGKDKEMNLLPREYLHARLDLILQNKLDLRNSFIFIDISCLNSHDIMNKIRQDFTLFTPTQHWMLLNVNNTLIEAFHFPINSNIFFAEDNFNSFKIKAVYQPSKKSSIIQTTIGKWSKIRGYRELYNILKEKSIRNLMREKVKISYVVKDINTVAHLDDFQYEILTDTMTKLNYALFQHLMNIINATKSEEFRGDFKKLENNIGMIDDLKSGEFDIGGTPIELYSKNIDEFSVLAKTAVVERKFIFRTTPHSYISNVFTLPFDSYVWYCCFGLIAIIFCVTYIVVYWEWKDPVFKKYITPRLCLRPHPVDIFLMTVGSAAQQGFETEPRSNSGRVAFIFTLISLMFLYTSFSASIVALLQSTTESLNSLDTLFESRMPIGFKDNISMEYFEKLKYENKSSDFISKLKKPVFLSVEQGIQIVQKEFFAFYADTAETYKYIKDWFSETEKCSLREITFKNTYLDYWLFMKKNSDYRDLVRTGMHKIQETGIRNREFKRLFTAKPRCDNVEGNFESVGLRDSYGAFLVMAFGVIISILLALLEGLWKKYNANINIRQVADLQLKYFRN
ncbi:ionotropic receptor 93a-like [Anthonomus grandis grandis]|uniref:ionotropic receptor 93a-like n=1 Tax=Anthonomus grandis grandis TaxID=2921223 RepID=UPI002166841E|nr:ionotropic receptor 93a-like [Anthonomus grandis grandis]